MELQTESRVENRNFAEVIQARRSIRKVTNSPAIDRRWVESAIRLALHAPSAFNMQSGRLVVLMVGQPRQVVGHCP